MLKVAMLLGFLCSFGLFSATTQAAPIPAKGLLAIDLSTGATIAQKNPDTPMPIASITKLMTALVLLDAAWPAQCVATIGPEDEDRLKGSRSALPYGYTATCKNLFDMMLFHSENRAATALARTIFSDIPSAVDAMNKKARSLGMWNSYFSDPTGLSPRNTASPRDIMLLLKAASSRAPIAAASLIKQDFIVLPDDNIRAIKNTNRLIRDDRIDAVISKTGFTSEAGRSLAFIAQDGDRLVGVVILGSPSTRARESLALRLLAPQPEIKKVKTRPEKAKSKNRAA